VTGTSKIPVAYQYLSLKHSTINDALTYSLPMINLHDKLRITLYATKDTWFQNE